MKRVALGIRAHSGWGALVAIAGNLGDEQVVARERIVIMNATSPGAPQPYHHAEAMELSHARTYIKQCAIASARMAAAAIGDVVERLQNGGCKIVGAALLLGSGRPLPTLDKVLASHPMIHTAEGVFFRESFRTALERLKVSITGIPERQLEESLRAAFGNNARGLRRRVATMGRSLGPPWTTDQKSAALAAVIVLAEHFS